MFRHGRTKPIFKSTRLLVVEPASTKFGKTKRCASLSLKNICVYLGAKRQTGALPCIYLRGVVGGASGLSRLKVSRCARVLSIFISVVISELFCMMMSSCFPVTSSGESDIVAKLLSALR